MLLEKRIYALKQRFLRRGCEKRGWEDTDMMAKRWGELHDLLKW